MRKLDYSPVFGIPANIEEELINIAKILKLDRLILFGSRAKGTAWQRSDIDLAAPFPDAQSYFEFVEAVEELPTLLMFDIVDLNSSCIDLDVLQSIQEEGIMIYEKI